MLKPTAGNMQYHGWEGSFYDFVEENESSLKERFCVHIDRAEGSRFFMVAAFIWNAFLTSAAVASALMGLMSLLVPALRSCQIRLFAQFLQDIGLL